MKPEKQAQLLVNAVISGQKHLFDLEQLKHTRYYSKETKNKVNLASKQLLKREDVFNGFLDHTGEVAEMVHDVFFDFMENIRPTTIDEMGELKGIIQAYRKDPNSILGIARKILK